MKRLLYALPVLIFGVLAYFLFNSLMGPPPTTLPSVFINKPAPKTELPPLDAEAQGFGSVDLAKGQVTVVNFFASNCPPCIVEAPELETLARHGGFALYGIATKYGGASQNIARDARAFLVEYGNPFSRIGVDPDGRVAIEWGVYGAPETFIIDGKGVIREKFVGAITAKDVLAAIEKARLNM
jgi:cytochrome c biogenesis protein CcmG/thiol:disulfide interchange protein DsbE